MTTVDLEPKEKQIGLLMTKVNLALTKFSYLPFDENIIVNIEMNNKKTLQLETDTILNISAVNVKFV